MQATSRFETTLPREHFYSPPAPKQVKPATARDWRTLAIVGIAAAAFVAAVHEWRQPATTVTAPAATVIAPTPLSASPLPEVRRAAPVPVLTAPRAELLHIRAIGTFENDKMPDGRVLTTRYMGELSNVAHLPTTGAQLGDMWFTRNDGHCWVLAPATAGSQTIGWVDP